MNQKDITIEIPKVKKCSVCGNMAKVNDFHIRPDDKLRVFYICDCGNEDSILKEVNFI